MIRYYKEFVKNIQLFNKGFISMRELSERRVELINKYSFGIPTTSVLKRIATYSPIIELGAGTGYWASSLEAVGCDILAYDNGSWDSVWTKNHTEILKGDERILESYKDRNLLLCFPMHRDSISLNAVKNFKGKYLIYIGELEDTCIESGDCAGFLEELHKSYKFVEKLPLPNWPDMKDAVHIYENLQFS